MAMHDTTMQGVIEHALIDFVNTTTDGFYKTLTLFGYAKTAGVLEGTQCCCVVPSRADSPESKYYSLALAAI